MSTTKGVHTKFKAESGAKVAYDCNVLNSVKQYAVKKHEKMYDSMGGS